MALNFTAVNLASKTNAATPSADLDTIPAEIKAEVEEAWAYFSAKDYDPDTALSVRFPSSESKHRWLGLARSYCAQRDQVKPKVGENLWIRVSPIRTPKDADDATKADNARTLTFRMRTLAVEIKRAAEAKAIADAAKATKTAAK